MQVFFYFFEKKYRAKKPVCEPSPLKEKKIILIFYSILLHKPWMKT